MAQTAKIDSFIRKILSREPFPISLTLEPTSRCDMECAFCVSAKFKYKARNMTMKLFNRIMKESIKYGKRESIVFAGEIGEPLLHPKIAEMVRLAKKVAHKVHLNTNGLSLNPALSKSLIRSGLDSIAIGLDGAKKETYESLRVGSSFEKVVENIKAFVDCKKKAKRKVEVIIRSVVTMKNKKEIPQIKKMWKKNVDKVEILDDSRKQGRQKKRIPCPLLWIQMAINSEGGVYICALEYDRNRILGSINERAIQKIWHGKNFNYFRACHLKNRFEKLPLCRNCYHWAD